MDEIDIIATEDCPECDTLGVDWGDGFHRVYKCPKCGRVWEGSYHLMD